MDIIVQELLAIGLSRGDCILAETLPSRCLELLLLFTRYCSQVCCTVIHARKKLQMRIRTQANKQRRLTRFVTGIWK
jgi:hypothetical protein